MRKLIAWGNSNLTKVYMIRNLLVLNDLHLGVQRTAGTTPASAAALRGWLHDGHAALIMRDEFIDHDLVYNGDIFDTFQVPLADAARLVQTWVVWLGTHKGNIHAGRGNHDVSKDSSKVSMFDFVCEFMRSSHIGRFFTHTSFGQISEKVFILPHQINQGEFDLAIEHALNVLDDAILLLHPNYDNPFRESSDHSLSVTVEQAAKFRAKNCALLFGHEHDYKLDEANGVYITGNQFPTSIADLLQSQVKFYAVIDQLHTGPAIRLIEMKDYNDALFQQIDWKDIDNLPRNARFIKVTGDVSAEDNVKVVEAVSALRQSATDTFVVANRVQVKQDNAIGGMDIAGEEIRAVNVFDFLYEQLEPEQATVVRALMAAHDA